MSMSEIIPVRASNENAKKFRQNKLGFIFPKMKIFSAYRA